MNQLISFKPMSWPTKNFLHSFYTDEELLWIKAQLEESRKSKRKFQWVCIERNLAKIGICLLEVAPPEFVYVSNLSIKEKHRRQGVGRIFMSHIETYCANIGINRLCLTPTEASLSFYQALLFVPEPLIPGILKKDIHPPLPK